MVHCVHVYIHYYDLYQRAQLLLTWPRNVLQFEFLLSSAGYFSLRHSFSVILIISPSVIHCEDYFWATFLSQTVWYNFNHCDVISPTVIDFGELTRNNEYYAAKLEGHSRSPISVPKLICDLL